MDIEKIAEFMKLGRSLNFRATAQELHLSQPTLSRHIQDIETAVGTPLIERGTPAGLPNQLTPAGMRFMELGGRLVEDYRFLIDECRTIGSTPAPARIQDLNGAFGINLQLRRALEAAGHHNVNVAYTKVDIPVDDALDAGTIDFAVHVEPTPAMEGLDAGEPNAPYGWIPLDPEPLVFMVGAGNPLLAKGVLDIADIEPREILCTGSPSYRCWFAAVPRVFAALGCYIRLRSIPDIPGSGGAFPLREQGIALVTSHYARYYQNLDVEDVGIVPMRGAEPRLYPFLVYRRNNAAPMVQQIVGCMGAASHER